MSFWRKAKELFFAAEDKVEKVNTYYESTAVGKLDKKLDDKYNAWLDKIFGLEEK